MLTQASSSFELQEAGLLGRGNVWCGDESQRLYSGHIAHLLHIPNPSIEHSGEIQERQQPRAPSVTCPLESETSTALHIPHSVVFSMLLSKETDSELRYIGIRRR